jgi:ABC-2 type transport system ATP-binding protein
MAGVHDLDIQGHRVHCEVDTAKLGDVLALLTSAGVRSLTSQPPTLEELDLRHYQAEEVTTPAGNGQSTREGAQR